MKTKTLTVYEYGLNSSHLTVGDTFSSEEKTISHKDAQLLDALLKRYKTDFFKYTGLQKIVAQQFVGVVTLGPNSIEILPKIDGLSEQGVRKNLISMLALTKRLDIKEMDISKLDTQSLNILEIMIRIFCDKFFEQLRKGLINQYEKVEENLHLVRGKINSSINSRLNVCSPEKMYCEYYEFQANNPMNRIFKAAFRHLLKYSKDQKNQAKISEIIFALDDVQDMPIQSLEWDKVLFDRQNKRYEFLYSLAKLFLNKISTNVSSGKSSGFALLFDMNELFEEFIGEICKKVFYQYTVQLQSPKKHLLADSSNNGVFLTKPDITITNQNGVKWILDTKWKMLDGSNNKDGVSQQDIYQMCAYSINYHCDDVLLLYPQHDGFNKTGLFQSYHINNLRDQSKIHIATINLENLSTVKDQLNDIVKWKSDLLLYVA